MFKLVISSPKEKKSLQVEKDVPTLIGMKIGGNFDGSMIGLNGYVLQITGGSDKEGFPMRRNLLGTARKKLLLSGGVAYKSKRNGVKKRKSVRGNTISEDISQINVKVIENGPKGIDELLGLVKEEPKEEEKKEETKKPEKKEEKPKEESKTEPEAEPKQAKPESKVEPKPEPEAKPEAKEEAKPEAKKEAAKTEPKEETKAEEAEKKD